MNSPNAMSSGVGRHQKPVAPNQLLTSTLRTPSWFSLSVTQTLSGFRNSSSKSRPGPVYSIASAT